MKKRMISLTLVLCMAMATFAVTGEAKIYLSDVSVLPECIAILEAGDTFPNEKMPGKFERYDINGDGILTVADVSLGLKTINPDSDISDEELFPGAIFPANHTISYGFSKRVGIDDEGNLFIRIMDMEGIFNYSFGDKVLYNGVLTSGTEFANDKLAKELELTVIKFGRNRVDEITYISTPENESDLKLHSSFDEMTLNGSKRLFENNEIEIKCDINTRLMVTPDKNGEMYYANISVVQLADMDIIENVKVYNVDEDGVADIICCTGYKPVLPVDQPVFVLKKWQNDFYDGSRAYFFKNRNTEVLKPYLSFSNDVMEAGSIGYPYYTIEGYLTDFSLLTFVCDRKVYAGEYLGEYNLRKDKVNFILGNVESVSGNTVIVDGKEYDLTDALVYVCDARDAKGIALDVEDVSVVETKFNEKDVTDCVMFAHIINDKVTEAVVYINMPLAN